MVMIAVAILMVFSVIIASVWVLSGDVLEGEYASAPSGIATLPADAPGTPGPDVQLTSERISDASSVNQYFGIHGGLLIIRGPVDATGNHVNADEGDHDANQEPNVNSDVLMAINPATGETIWEQPFNGFNAIGASQSVLIGREYNHNLSETTGNPVHTFLALDLATGEQLWSTEMDDSVSWNSYPGVFLLEDVVVSTASGHRLIARNLVDGEVAWETEIDPGEGWLQQYSTMDGETREEQWYTVAATDWNGMLVLVNGDGLVQMIDANTGELTVGHQFDWPQTETDHFPLELYSMDNGVVLHRQVPQSGELQSQLTAFDPTTGNQFWQIDQEGQHFVDVADNGSVALQSVTWESSNWLQRLFGNQGHTIRSLTWVDGNTTETLLTTEPGRVDDGPPDAVTDGTYACTRTGQSEISCYDRSGTRYVLELEPLYVFDLIDGVLYVPTEEGLFRANLP